MQTPLVTAILILAVLCTSTLSREQASCTQPLGQNILQNSDFESYPNSILPWVSKPLPPTSDRPKKIGVVTPGYNSPQAYGYTTTSSGVGTTISQAFTACNHTWYTISWTRKFTVFSNETIDPNRVGGYLLDTDTIEDFLEEGTNNTWITRKQNLYVPSTVNSSIMYETDINKPFDDDSIVGGGIFALDDFSLVPLGALIAKTDAPNLALNGDFETGSLMPWTSGTKRCRVTGPGSKNSSFAFHCRHLHAFTSSYLSQNLVTTKFQQYILSYDYKTDPYGVISIQVEDVGFSQSQGGIRNIYAGTSAPTKGRWVHHEVYFIANSNNTAVTFVYAGTYNAYDNISVREADI